MKSFDRLNQYLFEGLQGHPDKDRLSVRALLVWLGSQDLAKWKPVPGGQDTPKGFLSLIANRITLYSTFFAVLCR